MVAKVVPLCLIGKIIISNEFGPTFLKEQKNVPNVFSTRINKRDISTICRHTQLLLEEIEERFAIPFVRFPIYVVKAILYTQY